MTTFTGIPLAALDFYEDLEADNSKPFWTAHKSIYDTAVKAPLEALIAELAPEFGDAKLFRPYRDVRFSADKTPYKTHQGAWFGATSMYVHVGAAGLFVGAGYWRTQSDQVARLRQSVADDISGAELTKLIAALGKSGFEVGGEQLTRVPAGYPKDHERADLLRYKSLTASREFGAPEWLSTKKAKTQIVAAFHKMEPLVSWLNQHVGASEKPLR